ncbi:MAG: hypothetical protein ACRC1K_04565 [Planctomycetia bacterium]
MVAHHRITNPRAETPRAVERRFETLEDRTAPAADFLEFNDTFPAATALGVRRDSAFQNLTVHTPADLDVFGFVAADTGRFSIGTSSTDAFNDLRVELYDANGGFLAFSDRDLTEFGGQGGERIDFDFTAGVGYFAVVRAGGFGSSGAAYSFAIAGPPINPDASESPVSNDTPATATNLGVITSLAVVGPLTFHTFTDTDVFRFTTAGDGVTAVAVASLDLVSDVGLEVTDAAFNPIAQSNQNLLGGFGNEGLRFNTVAGATYFVRLVNLNGNRNAAMLLGIEPPPAGATAGEGLAQRPNLAVPAAGVQGFQNTPIPLGIAASLVDVDGSETLGVTVGNVPADSRLSAGRQISPGLWSVTPAELPGLSLVTPANVGSSFTLVVTARSREGAGQFNFGEDAAVVSMNLRVDVLNRAPTLNLAFRPSARLLNPLVGARGVGAAALIGERSGRATAFNDPDTGGRRGVALFNLRVVGGRFEYRVGGGRWMVAPKTSATRALLLRSTDRVRIVNTSGRVQLQYIARGHDGTQGRFGAVMPAQAFGGSTPFSAERHRVNLALGARRSADVALAATLENDKPSAGRKEALLEAATVDRLFTIAEFEAATIDG